MSSLGTWTDEPVSLAVVVTAIKRQVSKRSGAEFARLTVEDFSGSAEVLVFPEAWAMLQIACRPTFPCCSRAATRRRDQEVDNPTFIVESVTPFAELRATGQVAVSTRAHGGRIADRAT